MTVFRSTAELVANGRYVIAEDWPTQEICDDVAKVAARILVYDGDIKDAENVLADVFNCADRPFGCALLVVQAVER